MKSILFVSIAFPPKFDSEGLQVAKYFKYFRNECDGRLDIDVVTSAVPTLFMPVDASLKKVDNGYRQKIEIKIPENKYINFLLKKIDPLLVLRPDSKFRFFKQWKKVVRELQNKPSIIYSRSYPISSAIMAMRLKDHYNIPWIMHVSDPWADDPVANLKGKTKELNESLEKECFSKADKICLTSHQTINYFKTKYPEHEHKLEYFPNVYDAADITDIDQPANSKLRILHSGGLAGIRSPEPILKAVTLLPASTKENLEILFAGIVDRRNRSLLDKYKDPCIRYLGSLSTYKQAIKLQQDADVLLLIDFPIKEPKLRMHFLSKLLDYMIARKYILGVTGRGSTCWEFIDGVRGHCFEESEFSAIAGHLTFLVEKFKSDKNFFRVDKVDSQFDAQYNAKRLYALTHSVLDGASQNSSFKENVSRSI